MKVGEEFPVPVNRLVTEVLTGRDSRIVPPFSLDNVSDLVSRAQHGSMQSAANVWLLLVLEFWCKLGTRG